MGVGMGVWALMVTALTCITVRYRVNSRAALGLFIAFLLAVCAGGLLFPLLPVQARRVLVALHTVLAVLLASSPQGILGACGAVCSRVGPRLQNVFLVVASIVFLLGGGEIAARLLTWAGFLSPQEALVAVLRPGLTDYRLYHQVGVKAFEPDPLLFWRPARQPPYNRQGFRGPEMDTPAPKGLRRVICYGDSNTAGWASAPSWPELLHERLIDSPLSIRIEVANAGVVGYSSHQGLLRFSSEVETYKPDMVVVSFGWNDASGAVGKPDREYTPPPPLVLRVQRILFNFRFYLWLRTLAEPATADRTGVEAMDQTRVSRQEYRLNLESFLNLGAKHGARVCFLTRPLRPNTKFSVKELQAIVDGCLEYNREVETFAREKGALWVDAADHFNRLGESYFEDICHFNQAGREAMAALIEPYIIGQDGVGSVPPSSPSPSSAK